jgi:phosphohistidine phosphatase
MALYLVQHGLSLPKAEDPAKGLSAEGVADVQRIAGVAQGYGIKVARIVHSGKTRARQTAEIFAAALSPTQGLEAAEGINPLDDVAVFAAGLGDGGNTMVVGHLPFMARLAAFLLTGSAEQPIFKFQNGGIVCLEKEAELQSWVIKWALMPKIR